jgi:hypothetical protein
VESQKKQSSVESSCSWTHLYYTVNSFCVIVHYV